jgi:DNA-binding NtrC family response regulator
VLSHARILVVEDEMFIALELSDAIEAAQGEVVGPAKSVAEAIQVIDHDGIDAAILDRTLLDGKVTPVAAMLIERAIPFIFYSGSSPELLKDEFPAIKSFPKPTASEQLVQALADIIAPDGTASCSDGVGE